MPEVPAELARKEPPRLPELAEPEVLRHFTAALDAQLRDRHRLLSARQLHDEVQPAHQRAARRAARASRNLHPLVEDDAAQGALELEWELQEILLEVTGLDAVSLQPAAGSQGELTGLMLFRAYFDDRGEDEQRAEDRHPRHRARHEPGERDDGRATS